jgi:putative Ca2+/H+ antiporter (TMEM165/GDT1 family)
MMLANAPAVWVGTKFTNRIPIKWVHTVAAVVFIAIGILTLLYG